MEEMQCLLKLQEIDLRLRDLNAQQKGIPLQLQELDCNLAELTTQVENREKELKQLRVSSREFEGRVAMLDESVKRYKVQMATVKTNREYSAILTEIEAVRGEKDQLENRLIQAMERTETLTGELEKEHQRHEQQQLVREQKWTELQAQQRELAGQIAVEQDRRGKLARQVRPPVLTLYERIMGSRVELAVVPLRSGSCGGCHGMIPLQRVTDIRKGHQLHTCDFCGRILYYQDAGQ